MHPLAFCLVYFFSIFAECKEVKRALHSLGSKKLYNDAALGDNSQSLLPYVRINWAKQKDPLQTNQSMNQTKSNLIKAMKFADCDKIESDLFKLITKVVSKSVINLFFFMDLNKIVRFRLY